MQIQHLTLHGLLDEAIAAKRMSGKEVAAETFTSEGQISRLRTGKRRTDKAMRITLTRLLKDIRYSLASATEDYKVPTIMFDSTAHHDVYTTSNDQHREELDRQKLEEAFKAAARIQASKRTPEQRQIIDDYMINYMEEYASEETDWLAKAEYVGYSNDQIFQMFSNFNKKYGVKG